MWILYLCGILLVFWIVRRLYLKTCKNSKNVCVVVLGDVGRSPRMQYHALSFRKEGFTVDVIGYPGSSPLKQLTDNEFIRIHYLVPPPDLRNKLPQVLNYIVKVVWQTITFSWVLFRGKISSNLMMQNPPAIPTLPICWIYCSLTGAEFTIDWHNYAHSLMSLSLGKHHGVVKLAKLIEQYFGAKAHNNFCVTKAMKQDLWKNWGIKAQVLYDRPADEFHPISLEEKHEFLLKLSEKYDIFKCKKEDSTIFTEASLSGPQLRASRPGFIVSSTSWTEDEDFSTLLNALQDYETACKTEDTKLPDLICAITGKGPLKDFFTAIIKLKDWKHVKIVTPWLENEEYPKILASADLGVSLHTSSSGLDLPMKVVDMFGCCLPVCAYDFKCLPELVRHNENSLVFTNQTELAEQLRLWFQDFPNNKEQKNLREKFQAELQKFQENRWHGNWLINVLPRVRH